jgi:hypothetical protein
MSTVKFIWWRGLIFATALLAAICMRQVVRAGAQDPARKAVVVELFTSEGCSSCPPADALLARLAQERRTDGVEIIPLGLHVDYWNFQGWTDRFSSASYSERQLRYTDRFRLQGPYTPQLVFDGSAETDGDDATRAHHLIDKAAQHPALANVALSLAGDDKLQVSITGSQELRGQVILALTEDNLASRVGAGENNGRELHHSAVVRDLRSLGSVSKGSFATTVPLKIKKDWKRKDLRAVIFVQEPGNGAIDGAASLSLNAQAVSAR